ncbi:helix-turn-helix domain-containing protein [Turicibacter sanguinis]|nr:helix-turn-helix domain-containing protein [Turicibacter sanguinis]
MNREQFLKILIESRYPNVKTFSEEIGIPYTTVRSILERGVGNARVDNVIKICKGLGISPEELNPEFKTNEIIADTVTLMIRLEDSKQKNVYEYAKVQLEEQNKSNTSQFPNRKEEKTEEDYNDPTMVIAAHMDDDFTEEEMEEVLRFIEFAKSKRKK